MALKEIRPQKGFQEQFVRTNVDFCIGGGVLNCGKAQPYDALVCTPNGFVEMGSLNIGSVIYTPEGKIQTVLRIYEQGEKEVVTIEFDNGDVVECCKDHLWEVYSKRNKKMVLTTEKMSKLRELNQIYIKSAKTMPFNKELQFVFNTYILGSLIYNYTYDNEKNEIIVFSDIDTAIRALKVSNIESFVYAFNEEESWYRLNNKKLLSEMKLMNLLDKGFPFLDNKLIYSSEFERVNFLRGVCDMHGYISDYEKCINIPLRKNILNPYVSIIFKSLGCKVKVEQIDHVEMFKIYTDNPNKFFLDNKKHTMFENEFCSPVHKIKKITFEERKKKMRCILVSDKSHLYVTDNFIPTHNTFAAVLSVAEPSKDPNFNALFLRNNLGDLRAGGGIIDTFRQIYGKNCEITESGEPRVVFKSGAKVDVTHVADQSAEKVLQRFKGRQYDFIYFDEGTGFTWECFTAIYTRNRGSAKWTGKVRMTTNPEREHWLRKFLDWYIGEDGRILDDRNGVVRYFYVNGDRVEDVVWGNTKEEVYETCKISIDRKLKAINGDEEYATYNDLIKSFTFYLGRMSENKASISNNKSYVGSAAMMGGTAAEQNVEGNWNASVYDERNELYTTEDLLSIFTNDPQTNGQKYITADLADSGTDNFVALAWNGFHIYDMLVLGKTTPRVNAEELLRFAIKHNIPNNRIIYDAIRGIYINDYIPEAIPFFSYKSPQGMYKRQFANLKAECYHRLVECIKRRNFSIDDEIANNIYAHRATKRKYTVRNELMEELAVVRFEESGNGKLSLMSKKKMNAELGKGRSMDLLDPCAMLMYAYGDCVYGDELPTTFLTPKEYEDFAGINDEKESIYNEDLWC